MFCYSRQNELNIAFRLIYENVRLKQVNVLGVLIREC